MKNKFKENITKFTESLMRQRELRSCMLPLKAKTQSFANELISLLFPHFCEERYNSAEQLGAKMILMEKELGDLLLSLNCGTILNSTEISNNFFSSLPEIYDMLLLDAEAIFNGDPAAKSVDEVILAYPGFIAITIYRFAHKLHLLNVPIIPRILTEYAHQSTGIDINPGAEIGKSFFIDHGTGIVIGETTIIGDNVKIYQGVTLGALSVSKSKESTKRHPTIENNVIIYAQAVILGGETIIGHNSVIGGNVWLTESVPPYSTVMHKAEVIMRNPKK